MSKIRVLIVDDSVLVRRMISSLISECPELEVAGIAPTGRLALAKIPICQPDIVLLDIKMPEMDGLETLRIIRQNHPTLPVVMFSSLTERGASETLEALSLGATDYVTKPREVSSLQESKAQLQKTLLTKLLSIGSATRRAHTPLKTRCLQQITHSPWPTDQMPAAKIVAIGGSTGAPNVLAKLLAVFPKNFPLPIVIVQHMPPIFTKLLADRLNETTELTVREGVAGALLEPGEVWIAPGDRHMVVTGQRDQAILGINSDIPENSCRPAVDVLFRSVARVFGSQALCCVLTGMGRDGLKSCRLLKEAGSHIIVQDEESSIVWGMPGFIAREGLAHAVLSADDLGPEILRFTSSNHIPRSQGTRHKPAAEDGDVCH